MFASMTALYIIAFYNYRGSNAIITCLLTFSIIFMMELVQINEENPLVNLNIKFILIGLFNIVFFVGAFYRWNKNL